MAYARRYSKPRRKAAGTARRTKRYSSAKRARPQTVRIELVTNQMGGVARPLAVAPATSRRRYF